MYYSITFQVYCLLVFLVLSVFSLVFFLLVSIFPKQVREAKIIFSQGWKRLMYTNCCIGQKRASSSRFASTKGYTLYHVFSSVCLMIVHYCFSIITAFRLR